MEQDNELTVTLYVKTTAGALSQDLGLTLRYGQATDANLDHAREAILDLLNDVSR